MKKFPSLKNATLFLLFIGMVIGGCGKLQLLKDIDPEAISAGVDLKDKTIWEFVSSTSTIANDTLKSLSLYTRAIEKAGLKELLNSPGEYTVIVPRNAALQSFIESLGYNTLDEVPAAILKNIFLDNIARGSILSYELPEAQFEKYETLNQDSISFIRQPTSVDPYKVTINSATTFLSTAAVIRTQDLQCKNGIVHVVDIYTNYVPKTIAPDPSTPGEGGNLHDTILVTKDSYMSNGSSTSKNTNYGSAVTLNVKKASADFTRRAITQFEVREPLFNDRIGSVKVGLYCNRVDGDGGVVSLYEDEHVDWLEDKVSWANCPVPGVVSIGDVLLKPGSANSVNKWHLIDITSAYLNALNQNKGFINIGINTTDNDLYTFASREAKDSKNVVGGLSPFIVITSPVPSILENPTNTGIVVDGATGNKKISTGELKFEGAKSNNIFFILKDVPQNGYLVVGGRPLQTGSRFSQEQLEKGAVRYLYAGTGNTDSFSLEGQDFQGGFYHDVLTVNVTIN